MSGQRFRNGAGGLIDRDRPLRFTFNGKSYEGYEGDSLASALLANGVRLIGRSFKYHRPRGIYSAGPEEPNAMVQLGRGAETEPNIRATEVPLVEGLTAASQNCWPTVGFDVGAMNSRLSRLFPAGFYYKTFMWPASLWMSYEQMIRRMAGMGAAPRKPDPDSYDRHYDHCDVFIAGGGPAGLAAALAAGRSGARVILADLNSRLGGALLGNPAEIDGQPSGEWIAAALAELEALPEVTILTRATVFGYYDHNLMGLVQQVGDRNAQTPRQRQWQIRARQVVLATGSIERPLVFADNDRPGVMLASAAQSYVNRFAVRPGANAVVFTNNDTAYQAAFDLDASGVTVSAFVDLRAEVPDHLAARLAELGIALFKGQAVVATHGGQHLRGVEIMALDDSGTVCLGAGRRIDCDLLCTSGGWNPTVHLFSQSQGKLRYEPGIASFVPDRSKQAERSAGAARGSFALQDCLVEGAAAGAAAASAAGFEAIADRVPQAAPATAEMPLRVLWQIPRKVGSHGKRFVDLQDDVTAEDVALAAREGYQSVEHLKRYTTLGMGTDQGKTSNVNGLGILSDILGRAPGEVGTTTFRAPYTPVTLGAIAAREVGHHAAPIRRTPMHQWHLEAGAVFTEAGQWLRPRYYPQGRETLAEAAHRETLHVREKVGLVDVSTLGKIDIQGADAAEFLNRLYINGFAKLPIGKARYGVMLREEGMAFDDGTTTRLGENHYLMTTTTANAGPVMTTMEYYLQAVWPELDVHIISVTDLWASTAVAGPLSRALLQAMDGDIDFSNEALPFMGCVEGTLAGMPATVFRISFSGEMGYEVAVAADRGLEMWEALLAAGRPLEVIPYGVEALGLLRIEKGHVVIGAEIDGRTTADDLGFGKMTSTKKAFIGQRSLNRPALAAEGRKQLVGLVPVDRKTSIPGGAQIVAAAEHPAPVPMLGHVTSTCFSPTLGHPIAIAVVADGRARLGEILYAKSPLKGVTVPVELCSAHFVDPDGSRMRA